MPMRSFDVTPADLAECRQLLRGGSRSFYAASFLLPARVRDPAIALYAFCRLADDAVDNGGREEAVAALRERLDCAYAGRPHAHAADRAFADVVARFAVPRALPDALLEGLAWDAAGRRYESIEELYAYAGRVAGTVGAMMALLMGARAPEQIARACDLGIAMQLTNIARDVGEDARLGRLYLPRQWMREAGIEPDEWLAQPFHDQRLGAVVQRLLRVADALYVRAGAGVAALPLGCRPGICAARLVYAEIGRAVERNGLDSVSRRAVVPMRRKLALLGYSLLVTVRPQARDPAPVLAEASFLVDAVSAGWPRPATPPWWDVGARVLKVIALFEKLERRQLERRESF